MFRPVNAAFKMVLGTRTTAPRIDDESELDGREIAPASFSARPVDDSVAVIFLNAPPAAMQVRRGLDTRKRNFSDRQVCPLRLDSKKYPEPTSFQTCDPRISQSVQTGLSPVAW